MEPNFETRECRTCHILKPLSDYIKYQKNGKTYQHGQCKLCYTRAQYPNRRRRQAEYAELKAAGELPEAATRICTLCHIEQPMDQFRCLEYRCRKCNRVRIRDSRRKNRYAHAKGIAKRRGFAFDLTKDEYNALIAQPCRYCGGPKCATGMGLDRADGDIGYTATNAIPCCLHCNRTKADCFTYDEMLNILGPDIRRIREQRERDGKPPLHSATGRPRIFLDD